MTDFVRVTRAHGVLHLVLSRPEKKNALTDAMYGAMADAILAADEDPDARVVLIRGEGDMFTAGNDVADFVAGGGADGGPRNVTRFLKSLAAMSRPLVAAVQGRAVGVGTTLLLHCDYVVLAENAQLSTPFVSLALVPEAASSLLLPARIGHLRAFSMVALGELVGATDALNWGLASAISPLEDYVAAAEAVAIRLAERPLGAITATKQLMRQTAMISERMDVESEEFSARLASPEAQEAFAAFAQKRAPDFSRFR